MYCENNMKDKQRHTEIVQLFDVSNTFQQNENKTCNLLSSGTDAEKITSNN